MPIKFNSRNVYENDFTKALDDYIEKINIAFDEKNYVLLEESGRIFMKLKVKEEMLDFLSSAIRSEFSKQNFNFIQYNYEIEDQVTEDILTEEEKQLLNTEVTKEINKFTVFTLELVLPE